MTSQQEITVEDELWQIEDKTRSDGTVLGEILNWGRDDSFGSRAAVVQVRLPNGQQFTESYEWPASADPSEYGFVRLVEHCGYSLSSTEQIVGMEVPCRREDGTWTIDLPRSTVSKAREHGMGLLRTILAPVTMLWYWPYMLREDRIVDDVMGYSIMTSFILLVWACVVIVALIVAVVAADVVGWLL